MVQCKCSSGSMLILVLHDARPILPVKTPHLFRSGWSTGARAQQQRLVRVKFERTPPQITDIVVVSIFVNVIHGLARRDIGEESGENEMPYDLRLHLACYVEAHSRIPIRTAYLVGAADCALYLAVPIDPVPIAVPGNLAPPVANLAVWEMFVRMRDSERGDVGGIGGNRRTHFVATQPFDIVVPENRCGHLPRRFLVCWSAFAPTSDNLKLTAISLIFFGARLANRTRPTHALPALLYSVGHTIYHTLTVAPFRAAYTRGFWHGRPEADICAALTRHRANFWALHADECTRIVDSDFDAAYVYIQLIFYLIAVLTLVRYVLHRLCVC